MFVIKTDKQGKAQWQKSYGKFYNDYGFTAEITDSGYVIKGTTQTCDGNADIDRKCQDNIWLIYIDKAGKELSNEVGKVLKRS